MIGTPGGSRIISMVLLGTLAFAAGAEAEAIVATGRYHHQFLPDCIEHEPGLWDDTLRRALAARGHCVEAGRRRWGNMQLVIWDKRAGRLQAAADPRGIGAGRVRLRADQR
ncbi:MAG: hypothetical protein KatS3mg121_0989 [Gammaproteobacteria bacterium]|nr:MAG: hypothetical protein KatS3mg121_0989 [Gammaproteobacteria bacterium]